MSGGQPCLLSLRRNDPVRIVGIGDAWPQCHIGSPLFRHRDALLQVRDFLLQLRPLSRTALPTGIAPRYAISDPPGVAVVFSIFSRNRRLYEAGLRELAARRFTVAALRVIGPAERDPATLFRRGRLTDVETGRRRFITLSPGQPGALSPGPRDASRAAAGLLPPQRDRLRDHRHSLRPRPHPVPRVSGAGTAAVKGSGPAP